MDVIGWAVTETAWNRNEYFISNWWQIAKLVYVHSRLLRLATVYENVKRRAVFCQIIVTFICLWSFDTEHILNNCFRAVGSTKDKNEAVKKRSNPFDSFILPSYVCVPLKLARNSLTREIYWNDEILLTILSNRVRAKTCSFNNILTTVSRRITSLALALTDICGLQRRQVHWSSANHARLMTVADHVSYVSCSINNKCHCRPTVLSI